MTERKQIQELTDVNLNVTVRPQASHLTCMSPIFILYKIKIITYNSKDYCED